MSAWIVSLALSGAVVTVVAVLAGAGAAYLARRDGATYPKAIRHAAATLAATLTLAAVLTTALAALVTLLR
ncbi:hypothetical protein ACOQFV_07530 [Nocardiopsis changdeensis]|uniref:Uncharacterized protein n=1 Tax=Nocardiopsis changdeensis TaxID=2831969 RepID=A0ABX8BGW5_9ACTN|nr:MULTISPECIES: hypothetical protein [Nocardiopsis]QUX20583.1 hypothetical protein KGD84_18940 [Nocardiopsis changdeensis]QYX36514.1 hypothetical protein K1J57_28395 [Nocardiopsis sp. MT53]